MKCQAANDLRFTVNDVVGVESARRSVRTFALAQGLSRQWAEELVIAVSELATNLVRYATDGGTFICRSVSINGRDAIEIECRDQGPGIADLEKALHEGYSTGGGLGGGLASIQRLVDDFSIETSFAGTTVRIRKQR